MRKKAPAIRATANPTNDALEGIDHRTGRRFWIAGHLFGHDRTPTCRSRPRCWRSLPRIVSANAIYGATMKMLDVVLAPFHIETTYVGYLRFGVR